MSKFLPVLLACLMLGGCYSTDDLETRDDVGVVDATQKAKSDKPSAEAVDNMRKNMAPSDQSDVLLDDTGTALVSDQVVDGAAPQDREAELLEQNAGAQIEDNVLLQDQRTYLATTTDGLARPAGAETSGLPLYATGSDGSKANCDPDIENKANNTAFNLTQSLLARYKAPKSEIYVAPTMIPNLYTDCIPNLQTMIKHAIQTAGSFDILEDKELDDSFETFSSTAVPTLIRQSRKKLIPFIVVSNVRKVGQDPAITVRFIRVKDGITLFQSYRKLESSDNN